jgi:uncharacterized protein YkuJ
MDVRLSYRMGNRRAYECARWATDWPSDYEIDNRGERVRTKRYPSDSNAFVLRKTSEREGYTEFLTPGGKFYLDAHPPASALSATVFLDSE